MKVSCQLYDLVTLAPLPTEWEAKELGGPLSRSGFSREKKNLLPLLESNHDSSVVQPTAQSLY